MHRRTELRVQAFRTPVCRIVVPREPFLRTQMEHVLWHHGGTLIAGTPADLFRLGAMFRFAAISPHTVVYLPLPRTRDSCHGQAPSDLVLMRHDVPVRPSTWPALRAQLKQGAPATVQAPAPRPRRPGRSWDWRQNELKVREHAGTVFLTGTAQALFEAGDELTTCSDEAPHDKSFRKHGEGLVTQFNGSGVGRRDDGWEIWVMARSRSNQPRAKAVPAQGAHAA